MVMLFMHIVVKFMLNIYPLIYVLQLKKIVLYPCHFLQYIFSKISGLFGEFVLRINIKIKFTKESFLNALMLPYSILKSILVNLWNIISSPFKFIYSLILKIKIPSWLFNVKDWFMIPYRALKFLVINLWNVLSWPFRQLIYLIQHIHINFSWFKLPSFDKLKYIIKQPYRGLKWLTRKLWLVLSWPFNKLAHGIRLFGLNLRSWFNLPYLDMLKRAFLSPYWALKWLTERLLFIIAWPFKWIAIHIQLPFHTFLKEIFMAPYYALNWIITNLWKCISYPFEWISIHLKLSFLRSILLAPFKLLQQLGSYLCQFAHWILDIVLYPFKLILKGFRYFLCLIKCPDRIKEFVFNLFLAPYRLLNFMLSGIFNFIHAVIEFIVRPFKMYFSFASIKFYWDHVCDEFDADAC